MFFLKKLFSSLILPPGVIVVFFLILFFLEKKRKLTKGILLFLAIFLYLISIEPAKDFLFYFIEKKYPVIESTKADAIVILGGGMRNENTFAEDTLNRVLNGYLLYKRTKLPIIVSGGVSEGGIIEAKLMAKALLEMGVDENKLIIEDKSRDTTQNATYVSQICKEKGLRKVFLVTSAYHMERALIMFKKAGMQVTAYPTDFKRTDKYTVYSFLPHHQTFALSVKALREYIALIALRFSLI